MDVEAKTRYYAAMTKQKLAGLAAISGEDTYTRFLRVYSKQQLVYFMVHEFDPHDTLTT